MAKTVAIDTDEVVMTAGIVFSRAQSVASRYTAYFATSFATSSVVFLPPMS